MELVFLQQIKKKIFDRFYRVDKARTRQKGGFGLGLSLAKQIVDALKGTISVKDNKPHGTIFEVKSPSKHHPSVKINKKSCELESGRPSIAFLVAAL